MTSAAHSRRGFAAVVGSLVGMVRVIAYGQGSGLITRANTALTDRIAHLAADAVRFLACANTMKRLTLTQNNLLLRFDTVDSGVAEIIRLQASGWAYLKSGG